MLNKKKYAVYIVIALIALFVLMDATSRYSKIAKKNKNTNTHYSEKATDEKLNKERDEIIENNQVKINTDMNQFEKNPERETDTEKNPYSNNNDFSNNVVIQEDQVEIKHLKHYYIKSPEFGTIDTEKANKNVVYRDNDIILVAPSIDNSQLLLILMNGSNIIWKKTITPLSATNLKIDSVEFAEYKLNLKLKDPVGNIDSISFLTYMAYETTKSPINYNLLYFTDNTQADNYKIIKTFNLTNTDDNLALVEEIDESTQSQSSTTVHKKYYIYNMENEYLYRNSLLYENYTNRNVQPIKNVQITSDNYYTVFRFNAPAPVIRKISNAPMRQLNNQNKNILPLKYTYKYKIENSNLNVITATKQ